MEQLFLHKLHQKILRSRKFLVKLKSQHFDILVFLWLWHGFNCKFLCTLLGHELLNHCFIEILCCQSSDYPDVEISPSTHCIFLQHTSPMGQFSATQLYGPLRCVSGAPVLGACSISWLSPPPIPPPTPPHPPPRQHIYLPALRATAHGN